MKNTRNYGLVSGDIENHIFAKLDRDFKKRDEQPKETKPKKKHKKHSSPKVRVARY